MPQTSKIIGLVLCLLMHTACKQKDNVPQTENVEITVRYPADYFVVLPETKAVENCASAEKVEKMAVQKAEQIVAKAKLAETIKKQEAIKEQAHKKQSYQTYLKTRADLIRALRQQTGGNFLTKESDDEQKLKSKINVKTEVTMLEKGYAAPNIISSFPVSRQFILTEDRTIGAVLLDGINSQISGSVRAVVSEDVFGADGRYKLLEKGDVILGRYEKTSKVGETRLSVLFYRILRAADGAEIYASGNAFAYAADKMGRAGLVGEVDNRNWERYGLAFSTSLIGGIAGLGKSKANGDEYEEFFNRLSDNTTEITTKILEQYMKGVFSLFLIVLTACLLNVIMMPNLLIINNKQAID